MEKKRLIMIQIDGLSKNQFLSACKSGRMPFIASLMDNYTLTSFYSGLPSSTPAVQAELFYGIPCAVPSFSFRDKVSKKRTSMLVGNTARNVELKLENEGCGLFQNGSTYSDNYTAMALNSKFCITKIGTSEFWKKGFLHFLVKVFSHLSIVSRVAVLTAIEINLSVFDMIKAMFHKEYLIPEIRFIPSRVGICMVLRELIVACVCQDIAKGIPAIHCNFLGYDEQSHRRGPSSRFAHWTLRGIDQAIKRICYTAQKYNDFNYSIWIYSDHGQEEVIPYYKLYHSTIQTTIAKVIRSSTNEQSSKNFIDRGIRFQRFSMLKSKTDLSISPNDHDVLVENSNNELLVVGSGPVGHVYLDIKLSQSKKEMIAKLLVKNAHIPLVMIYDSSHNVFAFTSEGMFTIPDEIKRIVGPNHPFINEIATDIVRLVNHSDSGDFVLFGWRFDNISITFPLENGSHAGMGEEETHGFTLLPKDIKFSNKDKGYYRPIDLRTIAINYLKKQ